jgi:hypothetical protein
MISPARDRSRIGEPSEAPLMYQPLCPVVRVGRRSPQWRARGIVTGALALAMLTACGSPTSSLRSPSASAPLSASSPASSPASVGPSAPGDVACALDDLRAEGGPWDGAAGSRFAEIVVGNAGAGPCPLPEVPVIAIVDSAGAVLGQSAPGVTGAGPVLAPTATIAFTLQVANWCDESVDLPLTFDLLLASGGIPIDGLLVSSTRELPPCNGPGQPPTISAGGWTQR